MPAAGTARLAAAVVLAAAVGLVAAGPSQADGLLAPAGAHGHGDVADAPPSALPMMAGAFLNAPVLAVGAADFPGGVRVRYAAYTVTTADGRPTAARVFAVKQQLSATGGENTAVAAADVAVPVSDLGYGHTGDEAVGSLHAVLPSLGTLDVRLTAPVTGHGSITSLHAVQWNYNLTIDEGHQKTDVIAAHSYVRLDGVAGVVYEAAWGRGASGYVRSAYPVVPTAPA